MGILSKSSLGINVMRLARQECLKCKYHSLNDSKYLFCGGTGAQLNNEKTTENISHLKAQMSFRCSSLATLQTKQTVSALCMYFLFSDVVSNQ